MDVSAAVFSYLFSFHSAGSSREESVVTPA